jgi:diguanylate cyclase (GGDEF)-like protein
MPESGQRPRSVHLARLILVVGSLAFVSALVLWTTDLRTLWPLYIVPIVVAALTYHAAGAVVTTAIVSALIALLTYGRGIESPTLPELIVGMSAFLLSGIVIGVQAHRREQHSELLEEASAFDPLTGVLKREHLSERLAEEVQRSERHNVSCSLALVTVQDFERFHEQFGRYKAELLLEHMADILRTTVRETDVVGRLGPVTFGVVLPYSDAEGARVAMERVRAKVAVAQFEGDVLEPATHCAVAVAAATYPAEAPTGEGLVALAQARLTETGGGGEQ